LILNSLLKSGLANKLILAIDLVAEVVIGNLRAKVLFQDLVHWVQIERLVLSADVGGLEQDVQSFVALQVLILQKVNLELLD
jgi:hypothetical protein